MTRVRSTRPTVRGRAAMALLALGVALGAPASAWAQGERHAVVVQGASGGDPYAAVHRAYVDRLVAALKGPLGFDPARIAVLAEQPREGEVRGTSENVKAAFARLAGQVGQNDLVFVALIGHGGGDGAEAKFNLVGPDLTVVEWSAILSGIKGRLAVVNTTSGSFPYLKGLSAPGRVVITATNSYAQRYDTVFPDAFIQALTAPVADLDKNGRISLLEAFTHANGLVRQHYEQRGLMATERAAFNDSGDGTPFEAAAPGTAAGTLAGLTYLDVVAAPTSSDPELQRLLVRQRELTDEVDALRRRRPSMAPAAFDAEFERLIVELALVSRDVRRRSRL